MTIRPRIVLTLFFMAAFGCAMIASWHMPFQARLFPWTIGLTGLALLCIQIVRDLTEKVVDARDEPSGADMDFTAEETTRAARKIAVELFAWIYGLTLGLWLLGFQLAIPLFVALYLLRARVNLLTIIGITLAMWLTTWLVFGRILNLPFPPGVLFDLFS